MKHSFHGQLAVALRRLDVKARAFSTPRVTVAGKNLQSSRAIVDGMPWLHFGGASKANVANRLREVTLVAALTDRIPAIGIVHLGTGDLTQVQLPGWAFAALLRMAAECPSDTVLMVLSEYLPLGLNLTEADQELGRGIALSLEGQGQFSPSISDTA